jgi:cytochrome b561
MSSAGDHPISILGLFDFPKLPVSKDVGHTANRVHIYVQFAVYALIAIHVFATAWHLVVRRDAVLDRMLPRQANAD